MLGFMKFAQPDDAVFGVYEACQYLNIQRKRLAQLVVQYRIPYTALACGRVFFKSDLDAFQTSRQAKLKHRAD